VIGVSQLRGILWALYALDDDDREASTACAVITAELSRIESRREQCRARKVAKKAAKEGCPVVLVSAPVESELCGLSSPEKAEFLSQPWLSEQLPASLADFKKRVSPPAENPGQPNAPQLGNFQGLSLPGGNAPVLTPPPGK
jgi:hypothetical protein